MFGLFYAQKARLMKLYNITLIKWSVVQFLIAETRLTTISAQRIFLCFTVVSLNLSCITCCIIFVGHWSAELSI